MVSGANLVLVDEILRLPVDISSQLAARLLLVVERALARGLGHQILGLVCVVLVRYSMSWCLDDSFVLLVSRSCSVSGWTTRFLVLRCVLASQNGLPAWK